MSANEIDYRDWQVPSGWLVKRTIIQRDGVDKSYGTYGGDFLLTIVTPQGEFTYQLTETVAEELFAGLSLALRSQGSSRLSAL